MCEEQTLGEGGQELCFGHDVYETLDHDFS